MKDKGFEVEKMIRTKNNSNDLLVFPSLVSLGTGSSQVEHAAEGGSGK